MRSTAFGLAAALLGSMGAADAKQPVELTDAQLDMATAGYVGNYGFSTGGGGGSNAPPAGPNGGPSVSMSYSMSGKGTIQSNQSTGANSVQQNSVSTISGPGPF